jgi:tetratricopeptide (TPR) repeat protein
MNSILRGGFYFLLAFLSAGILSAQVRELVKRADSCHMAGNPSSAIQFYLKALEHEKKLTESQRFYIFRKLGSSYLDKGNLKPAEDFFRQAAKLKNAGDKGMDEALLYGDFSRLFYESGKIDSAWHYIRREISIAEKLGNDSLLYFSLHALALYQAEKNDFVNAEKNYFAALEKAKLPNLHHQLPEIFNNIGTLYYIKKNYREAIAFFDSSYTWAVSLKDADNQWYGLYNLAEAFYSAGDYAMAWKWKKKYNALNAEVMNSQSSRKIAEMQAHYDLSEKETRLNESKAMFQLLSEKSKEKETQLSFILILVFLLLLAIVSGVLVYYYLRTKNKELVEVQKKIVENAQTENELSAKLAHFSSQLNPEIFFTTLGTIRSRKIITGRQMNMEALGSLASLMRSALHLADKNKTGLDTELKFLNNYFELEKLNGRISTHALIEMTHDESDCYLIIPLALQPLIHLFLLKHFRGAALDLKIHSRIQKLEQCYFLETEVTVSALPQNEKNHISPEVIHSAAIARERIDQEWNSVNTGQVTGFLESPEKVTIRVPLEELF